MRRWIATLVFFGVVAAGCAPWSMAEESSQTVPQPEATVTTTAAPPPTGGDPTTTQPSTSSTSSTAATPNPVVVDGPPAPDFTLALDGGEVFSLSAEQKPVYMVFWAEW